MKKHIDLLALAQKAMLKAGFIVDAPDELPTRPQTKSSVKDLRDLLWSSIDDATTRDLDQVEYAERLPNEDIRVWIGIADVDVYVAKASAIDKYAAQNCTSVYTGVKTFPMLPEKLSTDLTSLVEGEDRHVVVTELVVSPEGEVEDVDIFCAQINNKAKLSYDEIGAWLEGKSGVPSSVSAVAGMESQINLQAEAASRLAKFRQKKGAIELGMIQAVPVMSEDGRVVALKVIEPNLARDLISNFMIAANVAMAEFLEDRGGPSLRRIVRSPEQWDRIVEIAAEYGVTLPPTPDSFALAEFLAQRKQADPVHFPDLSLAVVKSLGPGEYDVQAPGEEAPGHFGLAVDDYTHSTAPNRRFADLVTQRLVKAAMSCASVKKRRAAAGSSVPNREESTAPASAPPKDNSVSRLTPDPFPFALGEQPYTVEELRDIAARCTEREDAARKVERKLRKVAAALLLQNKIGKEFDAIVTGVTPKGTFARLLKPPVDGRVVRGERGLRVGDKTRLRLLSTDPHRGFIDFAKT